eukprot:1724225-Rhodomonas_salina.1
MKRSSARARWSSAATLALKSSSATTTPRRSRAWTRCVLFRCLRGGQRREKEQAWVLFRFFGARRSLRSFAAAGSSGGA